MAKNNVTIHDNFIRAILSDKSIATEYFQNYLPEAVSSQLDFPTLKQESDTYLSKHLRKKLSDIVYSCQKKDDSGTVKVCLLIEHKSFPDRFTTVQIGSYIFSGLEKQVANKEALSIIIPILLYHGRGKWKYRPLIELFKNLPQEWAQYVPNFHYVYNNLGEIEDEAVEALNSKFLIASLLSLKHIFQKSWIESNAKRILILSDGVSENLQETLIVYLFANSGLEENRVIELLEQVPIKDKIMNTLQIFEKKGRKEGIAMGIEIGKTDVVRNLISETDFTTLQIAKLAGVSSEFVLKIRSEMTSEK